MTAFTNNVIAICTPRSVFGMIYLLLVFAAASAVGMSQAARRGQENADREQDC